MRKLLGMNLGLNLIVKFWKATVWSALHWQDQKSETRLELIVRLKFKLFQFNELLQFREFICEK